MWGGAGLIALSLLTAALLAACASSNGPPPDQVAITPNTVRVETPTGSMEARTVAEDRAETRVIQVPPDAAWRSIAAVYGELELPVNGFVDQTHQISAKNTRVRGRLGKMRASQIVTCGADVTGDDKANSYELLLDVASAVGTAPNNQTTIVTMVTGNARPMSTSGDPVRCVTTGQLERRIATALTLKAAAVK